MKTSHIFIFLIILLAILFGFLLIPKKAHMPVDVVSSRAPTITENATTTYTTMHLEYPQSSATEYSEMWNFIQTTKNDFLETYGNLTDAQAKVLYMRADNPYELYVTTSIATSTKSVSYLLKVYQYTGGAHGGTVVHVFTYDLKKKLVKTSDVLEDNYISVVAPLARKYFYDTLEDVPHTMIDYGTEPTVDNFSTWYLTDNTVTFIFGQYQVGPYVIGIQEFPLEKSKIASILKPEFK